MGAISPPHNVPRASARGCTLGDACLMKGLRTMSMLNSSSNGSGNVQAMLRVLQPLDGAAAGDPADKKRRLLADVVRMIGEQIHGQPPRMTVLEAELNRLPP